MSGTTLRLKQPTGWFAAGREVAQALALLSDGAFKLFLWICLHADRGRGAMRLEPADVARALRKTEAQIAESLREMLRHGICQTTDAGAIQITDRFWPYARAQTSPQDETPATYVSQIKRLFLERRCVRSTFSAADEELAAQLYHRGVTLQDAEHAILLGSLRKYAALINNGRGTPITSLRYFTVLFEEVKQEIPPGYWTHVARRLQQVERQWRGFDADGETQTK
jgi:hypothetical protein